MGSLSNGNHGINKFTDIGSSTAPRCITVGKTQNENLTGNRITQRESTLSVVRCKDSHSALSSLGN